MDLSVIIPLHNAAGHLDELVKRTFEELSKLSVEHEVIFVDRASTDGTDDRLKKMKEEKPRVKLVLLSSATSFNESVVYGIKLAEGDYVVTMDGDLGYDPADIVRLYIKLISGAHAVNGWRKGGTKNAASRTVPAKVVNALVSYMTKVSVHDLGCRFKGFRRDLVESVALYSDMYRFISIIVASLGGSIAETEVTFNHANQRSSEGFLRGWKVVFDLILLKMILDFSTRPVWFFGLASVPFWLLGTSLFTFYLYDIHRLGSSLPIIPGISVLMLLLATSLTTFGFITELVMKTRTSKELIVNVH